ncbi:uncharacterized protein LOC122813707 isoform X1 [Protopterus annectens]|uniref:uncharacterized protein LOC122813707 isoform X1 n=1 Tax=Protopterus annectens TaxID=7888 RepID=UPI001CFA91F5|nr:uncharacterized protein LOC122813707 isoform X1 [Protopterus annectens]
MMYITGFLISIYFDVTAGSQLKNCCTSWKPQEHEPSVIVKEERNCITLCCAWDINDTSQGPNGIYVKWFRNASMKLLVELNPDGVSPAEGFTGWAYLCEDTLHHISALQINDSQVNDTDIYWCEVILEDEFDQKTKTGTKSNLTVTESLVKSNSTPTCHNEEIPEVKDHQPNMWHVFHRVLSYGAVAGAVIALSVVCFCLRERGLCPPCKKTVDHTNKASIPDGENGLTYADLVFGQSSKMKTQTERDSSMNHCDYDVVAT